MNWKSSGQTLSFQIRKIPFLGKNSFSVIFVINISFVSDFADNDASQEGRTFEPESEDVR